jgi:hypothetical protein
LVENSNISENNTITVKAAKVVGSVFCFIYGRHLIMLKNVNPGLTCFVRSHGGVVSKYNESFLRRKIFLSFFLPRPMGLQDRHLKSSEGSNFFHDKKY